MGSPLTFQGPGATAQAEVPWPATHCPSLLTPVLFCTLRILSYQVQTTQDIIKALFTPTENSAPHPLHPLDLGWYKLEAWSDPGNVDSGKTTQVGRNSRPPGTRGDKGFWWACCTTSWGRRSRGPARPGSSKVRAQGRGPGSLGPKTGGQVHRVDNTMLYPCKLLRE